MGGVAESLKVSEQHASGKAVACEGVSPLTTLLCSCSFIANIKLCLFGSLGININKLRSMKKLFSRPSTLGEVLGAMN